MNFDLRWVLVVLLNLLFILMAAELNHYLAPLSFSLFFGGLLLAFPILRLDPRGGFLCTALTAFFLEAVSPLPTGLLFWTMMFAHAVFFSFRGRFARETVRAGVLCAVVLNVAVMAVLWVVFLSSAVDPGIYLRRGLLEAAASAAAVAVAAPWFLALQKAALLRAGINLEAEQRRAR